MAVLLLAALALVAVLARVDDAADAHGVTDFELGDAGTHLKGG